LKVGFNGTQFVAVTKNASSRFFLQKFIKKALQNFTTGSHILMKA